MMDSLILAPFLRNAKQTVIVFCRYVSMTTLFSKKIWGKLHRWSTSVCSHYLYAVKKLVVRTAAPASVDSHLVQFSKWRPFTKYSYYEGNSKIARSFAKYSSYEQTEYICNVKETTLLEPRYGFVVTKNGKYFKESLPYCDDTMTPLPFILNKWRGSKMTCLNEAISIRYGWNNYWHFYNDALGTLFFLHNHGISKDIPIIVPEQALRCHYVREVLKNHEYFKKLTFIFQSSNQWIECKNIWFGKVLPNTKDNLRDVCQLIDSTRTPSGLIHEKIFLTRRGDNGRTLSNLDSIEKIAEKSGFSIVDTALLDVVLQKALFESAKVIVGLHGAGLANLIFSHGGTPKVLEIFPGNSIPPHYYWLSMELGYDYRAMYGSDLGRSGEFILDENAFSEEIRKL